jgi:hypothetical protein
VGEEIKVVGFKSKKPNQRFASDELSPHPNPARHFASLNLPGGLRSVDILSFCS